MTESIVITDMTNIARVHRYIRKNEADIISPVKKLWNSQGEIINPDTAAKAIQKGGVPSEWRDPWNEMIRAFVGEDLVSEWIRTITTAGEGVAKKINKIERKQFAFSNTAISVKKWTDLNGGKLIVDLSEAAYGSIHALLQHQIAVMGVTSPYVLAQRLKPLVGLTKREALAVARFELSLAEEGVSTSAAAAQTQKYAEFLHKNRAARIARTELSNSYNFGQFDSLKQAGMAGELPGEVEKTWMAGGTDPCDLCEELDGETVPIDQAFSSGHDHPTAHPQCECAVGYKVIRH
jgi:hypothetical protein